MTELFDAAPDRVGRAPSAPRRGPAKLFRQPDRRDRRSSTPEEAELAKLFTNTWRYIKFAAANQFYMMANDFGLDFERIRARHHLRLPAGGRHARRRVRRRPVPVQGHDAAGRVQQQQLRPRATPAMMVNEGLPLYLVARIEQQLRPRGHARSASSGMAFKGESDDIRSSLSLQAASGSSSSRRHEVLCTDPYVTVDPTSCRSTRCSTEADLLVDRRAAPRCTATWTPTMPGRRHLEPRWARGVGVTAPARLGRHPGLQRGRGASSPCLDRHLRRGARCRARSWSSYDTPDDTTVPVRSRRTPRPSPGVVPDAQHLRARPGERHPLRHRPRARAPVVVVTMADGSDDPRQIDDAGPPRRARRRRRRRVALHAAAASRSAARS